MKTVKPDFYDNFECKASLCTDSCCIGWEIDVDDDTYEKYKNVSGVFGKKLKENIPIDEDFRSFKLLKNERCPFLDKKGLCEIIINCGKSYLCDICREHPRFYEWLDSYTFAGTGLCCEKTCELLFGNSNPLEFTVCDDGHDKNDAEDEYYNSFLCVINNLFDDKFTYEQFVRKYISREECKKSDLLTYISDVMKATEPINEEWTAYIKHLSDNIEIVRNNMKSFNDYISDRTIDYKKLFGYILFRYYFDACESENTESIIRFSLISCIYVYMTDVLLFAESGKFDITDRINNVKMWSKQIEYSSENIDMIVDASSDVSIESFVSFFKDV